MLKQYCKYINLLIILVLSGLTSCNEQEEDPVYNDDGEGRLRVNLSPMVRGDGDAPGLVEGNEVNPQLEVIETLRIILIDEDGKVKANDPIEITDQPSSQNFNYDWEVTTAKGDYKIYVIANEASVTNYYIEDPNSDFMEELKESGIKELLDSYTIGRSGFENFISSLCFFPDFSKPLVMTSCYDISLDAAEKKVNVYLVNVATKFLIKFNNYRNDPVVFQKIDIEKIADQNYLFANIDSTNLSKDGNYWIDWLHDVAEDSNAHPDLTDGEDSNNLINNKWGWLTNYNLPKKAKHDSFSFITENIGWEVPQATGQTDGKPIPGKLVKGPFYCPESKFTAGGSSQSYTMKFEIKTGNRGSDSTPLDQEDSEESNNEENPIILSSKLEYVITLFRNTFVVVNVDMNTASEDIYVEIIKWTERDKVYGRIEKENGQ